MFIEIERIVLSALGEASVLPPMMINTRTINKIEQVKKFSETDNDLTPSQRGEARTLHEAGCVVALYVETSTDRKMFIKSPTYKELRSLLKPQFISDFMNTV